jgi:hypothetical protein
VAILLAVGDLLAVVNPLKKMKKNRCKPVVQAYYTATEGLMTVTRKPKERTMANTTINRMTEQARGNHG